MSFNWIAVIIATLIPMVLGFIWYNPKVFGGAWMKASGLTEESLKGANMPVIFGVSLFLSLLLSIEVNFLAVHQWHLFSILMNEPGLQDPQSEVGRLASDFMAKYGSNFRTFRHGVVHGALAGIFFVLPVLGTNALFERKGFKYIAVNVGYWTVTLALMAGVICSMP
ncbi:MAG: DUF1761 domain-containing protein [Saprospiraceae bacterium]|nr:DUF1761 domain-containing protein [Saprospiraceae bacterium]MCB0576788.1 DUF1761 domain-containing protein [Saprospiraceae bacterium]MCB9356563.1 DUF1761 domain-containing protein [Lewinellaceae bacterium]